MIFAFTSCWSSFCLPSSSSAVLSVLFLPVPRVIQTHSYLGIVALAIASARNSLLLGLCLGQISSFGSHASPFRSVFLTRVSSSPAPLYPSLTFSSGTLSSHSPSPPGQRELQGGNVIHCPHGLVSAIRTGHAAEPRCAFVK